MARHSNRTYEKVRVAILEFLDRDVFNVSVENCVSFLDPIIDSWDIDLKTFSMTVVPNRQLTAANLKRFEFDLRKKVGGDSQQLFLSGSDEVPPGFRQAIEEYYRSLAKKGPR